jgi:hypothetical protein
LGLLDVLSGKTPALPQSSMSKLPFLVTLGFILLLLGFAVQYFSIPNPETIEHLREELKLLRKLRKKQS